MTMSQQAHYQGFRAGMLEAALIYIFILTIDQIIEAAAQSKKSH